MCPIRSHVGVVFIGTICGGHMGIKNFIGGDTGRYIWGYIGQISVC